MSNRRSALHAPDLTDLKSRSRLQNHQETRPASSPTSGISLSGDSVMDNTASLEELQSAEQRRVLDTVAQIRKCGLDTVLPLPQIVVCGDQSAGKSSVLEALTEISFPRADNLCTRFATEIIMRRAPEASLTIKIIPDAKRPNSEQDAISKYTDTISDFSELPKIMETANQIMGIATGDHSKATRAFARDILSIEIQGPERIQLNVVDLPGLVQNSTKGVTDADVDLVRELTDHYISQSRTICLAVISATNDYANQGILTRVKTFDPEGNRSLGIITKPDRLDAGSGSEKAFIALAKNEDVFFKLGWHVLKNRGFEDGNSDFQARNLSEQIFFSKSNFNELSADSLGIETLRERLANILFEHIKRELPRLREDLDLALSTTSKDLDHLGKSRGTTEECREYLFNLSQKTQELSRSASNGTYEGTYFKMPDNESLNVESRSGIRRLRAFLQKKNEDYADYMRLSGHYYHISESSPADPRGIAFGTISLPEPSTGSFISPKSSSEPPRKKLRISTPDPFLHEARPKQISEQDAVKWVKKILERNRGRELSGNFNPLVIGELFWRQSDNWAEIAGTYVNYIALLFRKFFRVLLEEHCAADVRERLWTGNIVSVLKQREEAAIYELQKLIEDLREPPLNYNHYYTETVAKINAQRERNRIEASKGPDIGAHGNVFDYTDRFSGVREKATPPSAATDADMSNVSCKEALTCMRAIYKVKCKQFIGNVTEQVIERHLVRNVAEIFSPMVVSKMSEKDMQHLVAEPTPVKRQRIHLSDRLAKLKEAEAILKSAMEDTSYLSAPSTQVAATNSSITQE